MSQLNLLINGRNYAIACDDGQEKRVRDLSGYIDARIKEIAQVSGQASEGHMLVLAALVMADEIFELRETCARFEQDRRDLKITDAPLNDADMQALSKTLQAMAGRIDKLSQRLKKVA